VFVWLWACGMGIQLEPVKTEPPARLPPIDPQPAWSSASQCHPSALRDRVRRREPNAEGWRILRGNLDGVRGTDELRILVEEGKETVSNYIELRVDGRDWLRTSIVLSVAEMVHEIPFPDGATAAEVAIIEQALFERRCDEPDPSLQLLIDGELRWHEGPPVLPPDYVVREEQQWRVYSGEAHASRGSLPVRYPRPLTETEQLSVVSTAQGVIAQRDGAHAWLFVSRHHRNVRWPSEFSAHIEGAKVEVTRHPTTMDEIMAPVVVLREL